MLSATHLFDDLTKHTSPPFSGHTTTMYGKVSILHVFSTVLAITLTTVGTTLGNCNDVIIGPMRVIEMNTGLKAGHLSDVQWLLNVSFHPKTNRCRSLVEF